MNGLWSHDEYLVPSRFVCVCFVFSTGPALLKANLTTLGKRGRKRSGRRRHDSCPKNLANRSVGDRRVYSGSNIIQPRYQCLPKCLFSRPLSHLTTAAATLHFITSNELSREDEWCFAWLHDKEIPDCDNGR